MSEAADTSWEVTLVERLAAGDERGAEAALERLMSDDRASVGLARLLVALRGPSGEQVSLDLRTEWIALARELAARTDPNLDARIGALEARGVTELSAARSAGVMPLPALLAEVIARPDDDAARLAYAATLTRRGDPLGEFIAVQCELAAGVGDEARKAALEAREAALRKAHEPAWRAWLQGALGVEFGCDFRRGFADVAYLSLEALPDVAEALFAMTPVRGLSPWDVTAPTLSRLASLPQLTRITSLDLSFSPRDARAKPIGAKGARALFKSRVLHSLRHLNLMGQRIGDDGAVALARCSSLGALTSLNLSLNALTPVGAAALSSCARLSSLRALDLLDSAIGDEGAASLAASAHLRGLVDLVLVGNGITHRGASAIANASSFGALESLLLGSNPLGDEGLAAIARSRALPRLKVLQLWNVGIGPEGAMALAESTTLGALREVHVYGNPIGEDAAQALRRRYGGTILSF